MIPTEDLQKIRGLTVSLKGEDYDSVVDFKEDLDTLLADFSPNELTECLLTSIDGEELVLCPFSDHKLSVETYLPDMPACRHDVRIDDYGIVEYRGDRGHVPILAAIGLRYQAMMLTGS